MRQIRGILKLENGLMITSDEDYYKTYDVYLNEDLNGDKNIVGKLSNIMILPDMLTGIITIDNNCIEKSIAGNVVLKSNTMLLYNNINNIEESSGKDDYVIHSFTIVDYI